MASEAMVVKRWLQARLVSDATLASLAPGSVWEGKADKGTPTPYVVWTPVDMGSDQMYVGSIRGTTRFMYQVTGWITGNDFAALDPIVTRIDALLHGASGAASGGHVLACERIGMVDLGANVDADGRVSRQAGGEYRLWARSD